MSKKRILVIEDEVIIADDLCMILKKLDYDVMEPALSYVEGVRKFDQGAPDLVILDIHLSEGKSGIDIAHYILSKSDIPFIYLTSYSDSKTFEKAKKTMPYAYMIKPFDPVDVKATVEIAFTNYERFKGSKGKSGYEFTLPDFTETEKVILGMITKNMMSKEIAHDLNVSVSTVKNHRHNICAKLELPATTHSLLNWVLRNREIINSWT